MYRVSGFAGGIVRRADQKRVRGGQHGQKRAVLPFGGGDAAIAEAGAHVVLARAVGLDRCGKDGLGLRQGLFRQALHGAEHRTQEDMPANH